MGVLAFFPRSSVSLTEKHLSHCFHQCFWWILTRRKTWKNIRLESCKARAGLPTIRGIEYDCGLKSVCRCLSSCQKLFDHIYFVVFKGLVVEFFILTYKGVRFFPALHAMIGIFSVLACKLAREKSGLLRRLLQCRNFFRQVFPCENFFPRNQSEGRIFSEITHTPSKIKWSTP